MSNATSSVMGNSTSRAVPDGAQSFNTQEVSIVVDSFSTTNTDIHPWYNRVNTIFQDSRVTPGSFKLEKSQFEKEWFDMKIFLMGFERATARI